VKPATVLRHLFVEFIPDVLEDGTVYISIGFATVAHKCCCGCGEEVVTPLSPTDWKLTFNGRTISLDPSIGNWGFPCQSHYWIRDNRVKWAPRMSKEEIIAGRSHDWLAKGKYFESAGHAATTTDSRDTGSVIAVQPGSLAKLKDWWRGS
jgi:hypothetical protein